MIKLDRGTIIGYLEVLEEDTEKSKEINDNCRYYKCRCKCGNIVSIQAYRLNSFSVKSCGCIIYERRSNEVVLKASKSEDTFKVSAEVYNYVSKFNCNFNETEYYYRDIETRLELDMIIWELGIAIEFNGEYWHRNDTQQYIETKVNIARQLGLKLIIVTAYNNRMDTQISEHDNYIDIQTGITNNTDIDMLFNTILDRI